jgi:hypothetical protein
VTVDDLGREPRIRDRSGVGDGDDDLRAIQLQAIRDTRAALCEERGVPAFAAERLSDRRLVRRGAKRFIVIRTYLFHPGERPAAVEVGLRFDLFDQDRRPLPGFGISSKLAIQALREVNRVGEELPIPAVEIKPGGGPAGRGELMLTVSLVQVAEEPEPQPLLCFSLAYQDCTPIQSFALHWRQARTAMSTAFRVPPEISETRKGVSH